MKKPPSQGTPVEPVAQPTPFHKPLEQSMGMKFADMTPTQKWIFVAKLIVCIGTFGFVFPNVQKE
jgi:hypothetical protein